MLQLAVPAEQQVWKYKGQVLQNTDTLDDVEVEDGDSIEVTSKAAWPCAAWQDTIKKLLVAFIKEPGQCEFFTNQFFSAMRYRA